MSSPAVSSLLRTRDVPLAPLSPGNATEALAVRRDGVTLPGWVTAPFAAPRSGGMAGGWGRLCLSSELLFARHGTGRSLPLHVLVKREGKGLGMLCVTPQDSLVKTTPMGACFFGVRCVIPTLHSFPHLTPPQNKILLGTKNGRISGEAGKFTILLLSYVVHRKTSSSVGGIC